MFSFRRLDVYDDARSLVKDVYLLMQSFPKEEKYALCDQLRRSSISIPANIAEEQLNEKERQIEIISKRLSKLTSAIEKNISK